MVGRIISDKTSDPANQLKADVEAGPAEVLAQERAPGSVMPSQPQTTLGIPTKTSIAGWVIDLAQRGAIST